MSTIVDVIPNCSECSIIFDIRMLHGMVTMNCPDFVILRSEHLYFRVDDFLRGGSVFFEVWRLNAYYWIKYYIAEWISLYFGGSMALKNT